MSDFVSVVVDAEVRLRLADPGAAYSTVSLWCDLGLAAGAFTRVDGGWELVLTDLPVDRLEYLLDVDGSLGLDPGNPLTVPGAFGEHSWLPLPGYRAPAWLDLEPVEGRLVPAALAESPVGAIDFVVWSPADAGDDEPLPLLLSHDGAEMDEYGGLTRYVAALVGAGELPRMRVALLAPGARNERYAANPAYTQALTGDLLPALVEACPTGHRPVLIGQSLGALAALHAAWTSPGAFGGLLLQSGSFFTPATDPQESGFDHFAEVTSFVATLLDARQPAPEAPAITMVCGSAEENHANNRLLAEHLASIGVDLAWAERRDGHTWTCWRDLLDPALTDLLRKVWS